MGDARCTNLQTPMMWAITKGHVAVVRQLLDARAEIRIADSLGATPLMIAAQHPSEKRYQLMLVLMERGGPEIFLDTDFKGCTTAHWAAYKGDITALKLLVEFRADLQVFDKEDMSPLHRAVDGGNGLGVIPYLLESRSDPSLRSKDGRSCLDMARHNAPVLRLLRGDCQQSGSTDGVEALLTSMNATWLAPYYHYANSVFDTSPFFSSCAAPVMNSDEDEVVALRPPRQPGPMQEFRGSLDTGLGDGM